MTQKMRDRCELHKIKKHYERALIPQDKYTMNYSIQKLVSPIKEKADEVDGNANRARKTFDFLKSKASSTLETVGEFLLPVTDNLKHVGRRIEDNRNSAGMWLKQRIAPAANNDSQSPQPQTPRRKEASTVGEYFSNPKLPSPPKKKMKMGAVHEQLDIIRPDWKALRDSDDPEENEKYDKLVYAIGREIFDDMLRSPSRATAIDIAMYNAKVNLARLYAAAIVDKSDEAGQRFHALFSVQDAEDRQWTMEENTDKEMGIHSLEYYRQHRFSLILQVKQARPEDVYEIYYDDEKPNLTPHYRVQEPGNCFAQAPIQVHRCLQFVHNSSLRKDEAYIVNFSGFMRNFYHGSKLLNYVMQDTSDTFESVFDKLLLVGHCQKVADFGDKSFQYYVDMLKKHGPAVVKMFIRSDFHTDGTWVYEGERPENAIEDALGHAMMLIGVVRVKGGDHVKGDDIYFILQNTGRDKQFVLVRRDYFRGCRKAFRYEAGEAKASINFVKYEDEFKVANPEKIHAKKTKCDVSYSSHHFERPSSTQSKRGRRSTTSEGRRYTRWY